MVQVDDVHIRTIVGWRHVRFYYLYDESTTTTTAISLITDSLMH